MGAAGSSKAIEFVASAKTSNSNSSTTLVIDKPTGTQEGDLMVAIACVDNNSNTWTQPAGWNEVADQGAGTAIMASHYIAGASEPSSYTFTFSAGRRLSGIIITYRNAAYDTVGSISTTQSSGIQTASAITLAQNSSELLAFFANSGRDVTWSNPTSGLASVDVDSDNENPSWALYSESNVASGSTGSKSATCSVTNQDFGCFLLGIKPS